MLGANRHQQAEQALEAYAQLPLKVSVQSEVNMKNYQLNKTLWNLSGSGKYDWNLLTYFDDEGTKIGNTNL